MIPSAFRRARPPEGDEDQIGRIVRARQGLDRLILFLRVLIAGSIAVPVLVMAIYAWDSRHDAMREAENHMRDMAATLREHALRIFGTQELVLELVAARINTQSWKEIERSRDLAQFFEQLDQGRRHIATVWLLDRDGNVRAASRPFPKGINGADRDYFEAQRERDRGVYIGRPFMGRVTSVPSFGISRRRPSADGSFDGVISISASADYFESTFRPLVRDVDGAAALVRADGAILAFAAAGGRDADRAAALVAEPIVAGTAPGGQAVFWATSPTDGVRRLYGVEQLGFYPLYVSAAMTETAVLRGWYRNLVFYGMIAGALASILLLGSAVAMRHARREGAALHRLAAEIARRTRAEADLQQAQKMEAMGQLTGGIAHDFNNLLTTVLGNLELAQRRLGEHPAARLLGSARQAAEHGAKLTQDLLAFARKQRLRPVAFDLNALIVETGDLVARTVGPLVEVEHALQRDLWPCIGDPNQVALAIINLAANARDAMPEGGRLRIETANLAAGAPGRAAGLAPGDYVVAAVGDTGTGMSEAVRAKAFEPFFTTKEVGRGSGLGLSQVHGVVHQLGGGVTLDSAPGRGTCVRLFLRRSLKPAEGSRITGAAPADAARELPGRGLVLLVDDDDAVRGFTATCLLDLGYEVADFGAAAPALDFLRSRRADLLVADYAMPGMTGAELAREARLRQRDLPVLVITGYAAGDLSATLGSIPVLRKPFKLADLARAARDALATAGAAD